MIIYKADLFIADTYFVNAKKFKVIRKSSGHIPLHAVYKTAPVLSTTINYNVNKMKTVNGQERYLS